MCNRTSRSVWTISDSGNGSVAQVSGVVSLWSGNSADREPRGGESNVHY